MKKKQLSETLIPTLYEEDREKLHSMLQKTNYAALTTNLWTSPAKHEVLTLTAHSLDNKSLAAAGLHTIHLPDRHRAQNIPDVIIIYKIMKLQT